VGATENLLMAASLARGKTTLVNAAREPEIVDLARLINQMGGCVQGAGTGTITIEGCRTLHGTDYRPMVDRIEAGTYLIAGAATGGKLRVTNLIPKHLDSLTAKLEEMGVTLIEEDEAITVISDGKLNRANIKTQPYPGFPTDLNPQMGVLLCLAQGTSILTEGVWENRFRYVEELKRMGAKIKVDGRTAVVEGVGALSGAGVRALDLRAGAAMIVAGLAATGRTTIEEIFHIQRGYEDIIEKLQAVGADIRMVTIPDNIYEKAN